MRHAIDHLFGRAVLHHLAVQFQPEVELLGVLHFIARDEPRADGAEAVGGFALGPLAGAFGLPSAFGDVVDHAIACHIFHGVFFSHIFGFAADDDAQFHFPIGFQRTARHDDCVIGAGKAAHLLGEHHRFGRHGEAGLRSVVGIVQANGDEFLRAGDAGTKPRLARHFGQARQVHFLDLGEQVGKCFGCDVFDHFGQIPDDAIFIQQAWLFLALRAIAQKFHLLVP